MPSHLTPVSGFGNFETVSYDVAADANGSKPLLPFSSYDLLPPV